MTLRTPSRLAIPRKRCQRTGDWRAVIHVYTQHRNKGDSASRITDWSMAAYLCRMWTQAHNVRAPGPSNQWAEFVARSEQSPGRIKGGLDF